MNEEKLKELGLNESQISGVLSEYKNSLDGKYVTKEVFNDLNEKLKKSNETVTERDNQIKDLGKFAKDNEDLKAQLTTIQTENANAKTQYENELAKLNLSTKIRNAILEDKEFKPHDIDLVLKQINLENVKIEGDNLVGFKEQFDNIKTSKGFLFTKIETQPSNSGVFKGFTPPDGKDGKTPEGSNAESLGHKLAQKALLARGINPGKKEN